MLCCIYEVQRMDPNPAMDFVELLQHVPELREACIGDDPIQIRTMRLVSKEASRIALSGLRSYNVEFLDTIKDTNVNGFKLMKHTCLQTLTVSLVVSGKKAVKAQSHLAVMFTGVLQNCGFEGSAI